MTSGAVKRWLTHPVLIVAAMLVALAGWVVASPLGAETDSDFHLASIWCQSPGPDSRCERGYLIDGKVAVKTYAAFDIPCYAGKPAKPAECQDLTRGTYYTERVNNGGYPPGFYWVMGLFATPKYLVSILAMRALNAGIFVGLVTGIFALVGRPLRRAMIITLGLGLVPTGMFVVASVNPSSWAVTGIVVQFFALLGIAEAVGRWRPIALGGLAVVGGAMAASARGDAGAYAVGVSILAAWLVFAQLRSRPWRWVPFVLSAVSGVIAFLTSQQTASDSGSIGGVRELGAYNFFHLLQVPLGNLGVGYPLGWLDVQMPPLVWVLTIGVLGALIFAEVPMMSWWRGLAAAGTFVALLALPYLMLQRGGFLVGEFVQSRYMLPLLLVAIGVLTWRRENPERRTYPRALLVGAVVVAIAHSAALYANILRYTNGSKPYLLGAEVAWWWPGPVGPQLLWIGGSIAFGYAVVALALRQHGSPTPTKASTDTGEVVA